MGQSPSGEGGVDRLGLLAEVAATLSRAASLESVMRGLTRLLVPALGSGCEVVLADADGALRRIVLGPDDQRAWEQRESTPVPPLEDHPVHVAMRTGAPQLLELSNPAQEHLFGPAEEPTSARALGVRSAVVVPLLGREGAVGTLGIGSGTTGRFEPTDVALLATIGRLAGLAIENIAALDHQRQSVARLQRVAAVVSALSAAGDIGSIASVLADVVGAELGAPRAAVCLRDVDVLRVVGSTGYGATALAGWEEVELGSDLPLARACRERRIVVDRYEDRWLLACPIATGEEVIGGAGWSFDEEPQLTTEDLRFLEIAAEHAATALARTAARDELERSRAQLWALAEAGVIGILVGEGERITEANDAFLSMLGYTRTDLTHGLDWPALTPDEWRAQDAEVVAEMLATGRADVFEKEYVHAEGRRVPVMIGGVTLSTEPFTWIVFVADLSARAAAERAAEEARRSLEVLLDEQRRIATTLQRSLLPASLPSIPGIELHARYWPAGTGMEVGGDLYDVFPTREGRWGLLVGDVTGKGVEAAAVIATARHTARAAALHFDDPTAVLDWVHDAVRLQSTELGRFCTMAYATLQPGPTPTMSIALAAHPKPILVRADGTAEHLGVHGALLGVLDDPVFEAVDVTLGRGDLVVLFTDGITDAPRDESLDEPELAALLATHRDEPLPDIVERIRATLEARRPGGFHDDIALLLVRVDG